MNDSIIKKSRKAKEIASFLLAMVYVGNIVGATKVEASETEPSLQIGEMSKKETANFLLLRWARCGDWPYSDNDSFAEEERMESINYADFNVKGGEGWTAFADATFRASREEYGGYDNYEKVIKFLLSKEEVDVNELYPIGCTPLQYASFRGCTELVRVLVGDPRTDAAEKGRLEKQHYNWRFLKTLMT